MTVTVHGEWLTQAKRDLDVARHLCDHSYYEWASYAAQQAAEKALKSLRAVQGVSVEKSMKTHEISSLLGQLADLAPTSDGRMSLASQLSQHNQDARYPSLRGGPGFSAPCKSYEVGDAESAIDLAEAVVQYADPLVHALDRFWAERRAKTTQSVSI